MTPAEFKAALDEVAVTQRWFAQYARVSFSVVNRWATGKIPVAGYAESLIESLREQRK